MADRSSPQVTAFFHKPTFSLQYIVADPQTKACAIIDPVLDFDEKAGAVGTQSADELLAHIAAQGYGLEWILDTHPHADHFSAAGYLTDKTRAPIAIGEKVKEVQALWKEIYHLPDLAADGSQWDRLFADGEHFQIGSLDAEVMLTPGHTLASVALVISDAAFIHDTLFMPDYGTARADFPGGDARALWRSIQRILTLPGDTRLFTGHDYLPGGRDPAWESTVRQQREKNIHIAGKSEEEFIALRDARDRKSPLPTLMLHALQVNILGGRLPSPESNGRRYLKIPIDILDGAWRDDG
jgi:glyoxylase-like metal-dependent hydrolase (beta-lactamase superfamily II)